MQVLAGIAVVIGDLAVIGAALGWGWRRLAPVRQMAVDWAGTAERRDPAGNLIQAAQPSAIGRVGALERSVAAIHKELHPNGGSSTRDVLDRLEARINAMEEARQS